MNRSLSEWAAWSANAYSASNIGLTLMRVNLQSPGKVRESFEIVCKSEESFYGRAGRPEAFSPSFETVFERLSYLLPA